MYKALISTAIIAGLSGLAGATVYTDNVGNELAGGDLADFFQSQGFDHLDLVQVEITDDGTNITFDIQANADLDATNWGKYALGINNGSGPSDAGNGWGRNIDWGNGQEITHWVATWADDGGSGIGGQVWDYDGANWNNSAGLFSSDDSQHASGHQIFTVALADLGLSAGDTFTFDVVTTGGGGGDPGVDHLSDFGVATPDWSTTSVGGQQLSYTVTPTPGALALLGLGGLVATKRRR